MSFQKTINKVTIEVIIGDISKAECEAIVIPTNTRLLPSGELRCKVLKDAGAKVQVECNYLINEIGMIPDGTPVVTSGGDLNIKHIIHVVGPKMAQKPETKKLMYATWNSLKIADDKRVKSVALPSISKRVFLFTPSICANVMVPTINKFLMEQNKNLEKILIVIEDKEDYEAFSKEVEALSY